MSINPLNNIKTSANFQLFRFESEGTNKLLKHVQFDMINKEQQLYNMGLCTVLENEVLDCEADTKNGDMQQVLETTAYIAMLYLEKFPDRQVFLGGSDSKRSRKYQMGIGKYIMELSQKYEIEGVMLINKELGPSEPFVKNKNYDGFIIRLRKED